MARVAVPVPGVLILFVNPLKYSVFAPVVSVTPFANVNPLTILSVPLSVMLLPMVTPFSVPLLLVNVVPVRVPFRIVPLKEVKPPVPNRPALPKSSTLPVLVSVVFKFTVPPVRV